jgi:hypothetical protein
MSPDLRCFIIVAGEEVAGFQGMGPDLRCFIKVAGEEVAGFRGMSPDLRCFSGTPTKRPKTKCSKTEHPKT